MFLGKSSDNGGTVAINWELNYYVALHKSASYNTISHPHNSHHNRDQKSAIFSILKKENKMNIISKNSLQPSKVFLSWPTPSILGESEPWVRKVYSVDSTQKVMRNEYKKKRKNNVIFLY